VCFECRFWEVEEFLLQWSSLNLRRFTMVGSQMETNMIRGSSDSRYLQKFRLYETRSVCTWITRSLFFNCYPYVVEFVGFCFSFFVFWGLWFVGFVVLDCDFWDIDFSLFFLSVRVFVWFFLWLPPLSEEF
jgi:hypothetical protein